MYFPIRAGRYDVYPALSRLGSDFGNGPRDGLLFQFDQEFSRYRADGLAARTRRPGRHVCRDGFDAPLARAVTRLLVSRLATEHSTLFALSETSGGTAPLDCRLTGETLRFDADWNLLSPARYEDAWDALCCQVQEDLAVVRRTPTGEDQVAALHVCAPSRWAPEEKVGRSFDAAHAPVPGMEKARAAAPGLVEAMISRPPMVRFTWGIEFDDRLDLHSDPPPGVPVDEWGHRGFAPDADHTIAPLYLRVERQVLWGLPEVDAALFAIRVYVYDARPLRANPARRDALASALRSMSPESRLYKGLPPDTFDAVMRWLNAC